MRIPSYQDVVDAEERIRLHVHRTPVFSSRLFNAAAGTEVVVKAENLQKIGAFKARGATNTVLTLSDEELSRGVATHSSGNHGQAVAYASSIVGVDATIVMPESASGVKVAAIRSLGAQIVFCPQPLREATLAEIQAESGATIVHPFNDPRVIAGQGTAALELMEQTNDIDMILTPIGGGGLLSGSALVAGHNNIVAVGAEPEVVDDAYRSLRDGVLHPATGERSVGDGLLTGIGEIPFAILTQAGTQILTVTEEEILEAMRFVVTRMKLVIEPSSATAFAALLRYRDQFAGHKVGVIASGGNVDLEILGQ
jgi:threonine dehydratase